MRTYEISFIDDYAEYEEWGKTDPYWKQKAETNPDDVKLCKKYSGKTITINTLEELEEFIAEVGTIIFDGDTITVYNGYAE